MKNILYFFFVAALFSCKDKEKIAMNEFETNSNLRNKLIQKVQDWYPQRKDTVTRFDTITQKIILPGKEIKIITPAICKGYYYDTLINGLSIYADSNGIVITGTLEAKIINRTRDIVNQKPLEMARDSIREKDKSIAVLTQRVADSKELVKSKDKQYGKLVAIFIGTCILFALIIGLILKLKFKI
jgi:hypothetical protein